MMTDNDNPFADPSVSGASGGGDSDYDQLPPSSETPASSVEDWLESSPETEYASSYKEGPMETESYSDKEPLNPLDTQSQPTTPSSSGSTTVTHLKKITDAVADIRTAPLSKLIFYMRIANVLVATLMITSAILTLLADSSATLGTLVICVYMSCFGCLLCCFEAHLKTVSAIIADNFGFMYNARGRFIFLVLLSTLCFSLDLIGKITGILLCLTACLNLFVIVKFPEYTKDTFDADQAEEGNESLQSLASTTFFGFAKENPDAVQAAVKGTAKFAFENPELAKNAHEAWSTGSGSAPV